jgi:hypothetical protein
MNPIDILDAMIQDTLDATRDVPFIRSKYGVEQVIGFRIAILKEVKDELVKARLRELDPQGKQSFGFPPPDKGPLTDAAH